MDPGLAQLPALRDELDDPATEGEPAAAFPKARKSARQIYRVLGNVHYSHLDELLRALDSCLAGGFTQPTLMRTCARKPFRGALSELRAAEHFLFRDFAVHGFDATREQTAVPDFLAESGGLKLAVEVYCPRQWEELGELVDGLRDVLKNFDSPFDYGFEVGAAQLERFGAESELLHLDPGDRADTLDRKTRAALVGELLDELTSKLDGARPDLRFEREQPDLNIKVSIALDGVRPSNGRLPDRFGRISGPSISGYAPEAMFEQIAKRVLKKAAKGQAVGHAPLSLLVVDLSNSELTGEFSDLFYREQFERTLKHQLGDGLRGYDMIAFCEGGGWQREMGLHYLVYEDGVSAKVQHLIFGDQLP